MATIREIAEKCGVSKATVSKALNGYDEIGSETAKLVIETAAALGYHPDSAARVLKTRRSNNLGVLFIDKARCGLGHEYFSVLLENFKAQAETRGYDITFISRNVGGRPMSYLEHCRYRRCDGVVIACVDFDDPQVLELVNGEIPVVTIDHVFERRTAVLSDNERGAQELVRYIHSQGHRRIAYIHGEDTAVTRKRVEGFRQACAGLSMEIPEGYLVPAAYHNVALCAVATHGLLELERPPTCIIYPDDYSAVGCMSELEQAGLSAHADISVAGYDGIYMLQNLKLTTYRQNTTALGTVAADKLIDAVTGRSVPEQVVVSGTLLHGSTVKKINI